MKVDCVVVGSGISGLTASAILSRRGYSVALVESKSQLGGSLRQFKRGGLAYDVGFHYTGCLGDGEILDLLWRYCGIRDRVTPIRLSPDGYDHYEFTDGSAPIRGYFDYQQLRLELHHHFPREKSAIDLYFETIRKICDSIPFYKTELELTSFLRGYKEPARSLLEFLNQHINDPRLKSVLEAPGFLYGVPTAGASLEVHALVSHGYYNGAWTVAGGGQTIVDSFVQKLDKDGVHIVSGCSVEMILSGQDGVSGVRLDDGDEIECTCVIYTGHPATVVDKVPPGSFRPAYRHRLSELRNTLSMFAVFGEAEKKLNTLQGPLNYYLLPVTGEVMTNRGQAVRPMMMTSTRTNSDRLLSVGENGIILLRLGTWADVKKFSSTIQGRRTEEYDRFKEEQALDMLDVAGKRWHDLTGNIELRAAGSPLTVRDELSAPEGCTYGAMHCLGQYTPEVRTRLPGLYLAGQSTLMTGVVGASISGMVAAGEILGLEELWQEVRQCR